MNTTNVLYVQQSYTKCLDRHYRHSLPQTTKQQWL